VYIALVYTSMVSHRLRCQEAWGQLLAALRRRHELIPSIAQAVSSTTGSDRQEVRQLHEAGDRAKTATGPAEKLPAENTLTDAMWNVLALADEYAALKAQVSFVQVQEELTTAENHIALACRQYNQAVEALNQETAKTYARPVASVLGAARVAPFSLRLTGEAEAS
jgi:LemA protein